MARYAVFYTETNKDNDEDYCVKTVKFNSFEEAVQEYIENCYWSENVILADLQENKIIKQFARHRAMYDGEETIFIS